MQIRKYGLVQLLSFSIWFYLLIFSLGCVSWFTPQPVVEDKDEEVHVALRRAYYEMEQGHYFYAQEIIRPYLDHPRMGREARLLNRHIEFLINYRNLKREQNLSAQIALHDVEKRLVLPETYNERKYYLPRVGPFVLEPGPMEQLLNQPVSIEIENANLSALLAALSKIEGINFIADDGLEVEKSLTIKVTGVPLRDILGYIERNMGLNFIVTKNVIWITKGEAAKETGPKLETKIIYLRKGYIPGSTSSVEGGITQGGGGRPGGGRLGRIRPEGGRGEGEEGTGGEDDLLDALTAFLTDPSVPRPEGASFRIFRNRNILIIRDTRDNIRMAQELIDAFDRDYLQVLIETRFLTIRQSDLFALGTKIDRLAKGKRDFPDYTDPLDQEDFFFGGPGQPDQSSSIRALLGMTGLGVSNTSGNIRVAGVLDKFMYDLTLGVLDQLDSVKTLSAPRVTVINNHEARIRRGSTKYYFDEFEASSNDITITGGQQPINPIPIVVPVGSAKKLELGLSLVVRPSVGNDGRSITMQLEVNITDFIGFNSDFVNADGFAYKLPETRDTEIKTVVSVNSGQTVVLGGTLTNTAQDKVAKIPILGDIPLIGWLFKRKELSNEPEHLLIFVTADIVDLDGRFRVGLEREEAAKAAVEALKKRQLPPEKFLKELPSEGDRADLEKAKKILEEEKIAPENLLKDPDEIQPQ